MRQNKHKNIHKLSHDFRHKANDIGNPSEVSAALNIPRTTLLRYLDGSALPPATISAKVDELHKGINRFMRSLPAKIGAMAAKDFPQGIISEQEE